MQPPLVPVLRRLLSSFIGLVSIIGAYGAWSLGHGREPERYVAAALVLLLGGVLWVASSLLSRYHLSSRDYGLVAGVLILGLLVGLVSSFYSCGGECNGTGFCHWYLGYPGRWLRLSGCGGITIIQGLMSPRAWDIDVPSLMADVFFWSGAGATLLFIRKTIGWDGSSSRL